MAGVIGQFLADGTYYSSWFSAKGNGAEMTVDVIGGPGTVDVTVETKNSENADDTIGPITWPSGAVAAPNQVTWKAGAVVGSATPGLLELVRFKYVVTGGGTHMRVLNPAWYTG